MSSNEIVFEEESVRSAFIDSQKVITIYDPQNDSTPGIVLGIQAIFGSVWWIVAMFLYIKNNSSDQDLHFIGNTGATTVPIAWWWERILESGGTQNWHAASLLSTFILYFAVSFIEMIAWFTYLDGYYEFARFYFSTIGYWASIFFYIIPFVFETVQLIIQGSITFPGTWAIYHMLGSLIFWLFAGLSHIFYIDDFISFIDAREPSKCICTAPEVLQISADADQETRLAWKFAIDQRRVVCDIECPLKELAKKCGLKRLTEQSDQEYIDACNAVIIKVRQENRAALRAAEARGLRSSFPEEDEDVEEEETAVVTDVEVEDVSTDDISGLGW